jgi:hypothetical protein
MKRFAVFIFPEYYPSGGWDDLYGIYDDLHEAMEKATSTTRDLWQVVDLQSGTGIKSGKGSKVF